MGLIAIASSPLQAARFQVRIEKAPGVAMTAKFESCSELEIDVKESSIRQGGSMIPTKAPSLVDFKDITLSRGATLDAELFNWFAASAAPTPAALAATYRSVDIIEFNRARQIVNRLRLFEAWGKNLKRGPWNNSEEGFLMESLTIAFAWAQPIGLVGAEKIGQIASLLP